jgi:hypothetical protein
MAVRKKEQVLTMIPADQITFKPPFDSVSDSSLKLSNPSDKFVAFKIKTTAPQRYCVRPNAGTIPPGDEAEIKVMLQPGQIDERHKFMVQSIFVPAHYAEVETKDERKEFVAELWKAPAENPVMSSKLICNFLQTQAKDEGYGDDAAAADVVSVSPPEPIKTASVSPTTASPVTSSSSPSPPQSAAAAAKPVEEKLYQHNQTVEKPKKVQIRESKPQVTSNSPPSALSSSSNDQSEEIRRLRAQLTDAMKQIEILSSAPPPSQNQQTPEQQKLFLVLLFVAFIAGFVLSCLV